MKKRVVFLVVILLTEILLFSFLLYRKYSSSAVVVSEKISAEHEKEVINGGNEEISKVALTFDDGPHPFYTEQLLDGLAERDVKVTFFITGMHAESYSDIVKRISDEGHLIGNHTYSHIQLSKKNRDVYKQELIMTNEILFNITGKEVEYVRPPYGTWDKQFEKELSMFPVLWNIDPLDWCSTNVDCITKRVVSKVKENDIILMHDEYPTTVTAALKIIDILKEKGYTFVTVDEILFE